MLRNSLLKTRIIILTLIYMATLYKTTQGKTRHAEIVATIDGDTLYQVLPPDAIPAIRQPRFLQGSDARAQMSDAEMVMGILFEGEARADHQCPRSAGHRRQGPFRGRRELVRGDGVRG